MTLERYCAIYVNKTVDFEEKSYFDITIQMIFTEFQVQPKLNITQIRINIEDINDNEPEFFTKLNVINNKLFASLRKDTPLLTRVTEIKVSFVF